jgi:hypothetical protein
MTPMFLISFSFLSLLTVAVGEMQAIRTRRRVADARQSRIAEPAPKPSLRRL